MTGRLLALSTTLVCALSGCLYPKAGSAPSPLDTMAVEAARTRWPDADAESLESGRQLFLGSCDGCHAYPALAHYEADEWPRIMKRMGGKADLSPEQTEQVLRFILVSRTQTPGAEAPR